MAPPPTEDLISVQVHGEEVTSLPMRPATAGDDDGKAYKLACRLHLTNHADSAVVFRWQGSRKDGYVVRSARGSIEGKGGRVAVEILSNVTNAAEVAQDKFRLSFAWGDDADQRWAELDKMTSKESRGLVTNRKLTIALADADDLEDPVPEEEPEAEEGEVAEEEDEEDIPDDPAAWGTAKNNGFCVSTTVAGDGYTFPQKGDRVLVHYTGMLRADGRKFDSSRKPGRKPFETMVGMAKLIKGWDEGLRQMAQGERAILRVTADYAYKAKGFADSDIPPNADLIFDIELLAVSPRPTAAKVKKFTEPQRYEVIRGFYDKHDSAKTDEAIRDILAKDKYKQDFSKLCKMLQKKYEENPAVLWWEKQELKPAPANAAAKATAPKKDAKAFPGATASISFNAETKAPAFGNWSSQAPAGGAASGGGLFGSKSSSAPAFSFTTGLAGASGSSSGSATVGKPAFGAPSVLGLAQPAFGSAGAAPAAASSAPAFSFAAVGQAGTSSAPSFSFAKPAASTGAAAAAPAGAALNVAAPAFSFKPADAATAAASGGTPPSTAAGVPTFKFSDAPPGGGTKLSFSTPVSTPVAASPVKSNGDSIPIEEMTMKQVTEWGAGLKLECKGDPFAGHNIDGLALKHLGDAALQGDLTVARNADRKTILSGIAILESAGYDTSVPPPTQLQGLFSTAAGGAAASSSTAGASFSFSSTTSDFSFSPAAAAASPPVAGAATSAEKASPAATGGLFSPNQPALAGHPAAPPSTNTASPASASGTAPAFSFSTSSVPSFSFAAVEPAAAVKELEYSYSSKPGFLSSGNNETKLQTMSTKQIGAFYRHVCKAGSLVDAAVSVLKLNHVDGEAMVHLTMAACIEELHTTQTLGEFIMGARDRLVTGPGAFTVQQPANPPPGVALPPGVAVPPAPAAAAAAAAPPVKPVPATAFAGGEKVSAMPASVSGGHCFVSSGGAGILVAHTLGHNGEESTCMRGPAMAHINVAGNGAGTATLAFEPGGLAIDVRPPVPTNVPAATMSVPRPGAEMTADARLRELEYNDAMKQNAELKAKVEELGGQVAADDGMNDDKAEKKAEVHRSSISCLASGDGSQMAFSNPHFEIKGHEVNARENVTCRSTASATEGRWYCESNINGQLFFEFSIENAEMMENCP